MTRNRAKDQREFQNLISKVSHDARNSIRALGEVSVWIREDIEHDGQKVSEGVGKHLDMLGTHAQRLDQLVEDLVTFFRIGQPDALGEADLNGTLDHVLDKLEMPVGFSISRDIQLKSPMMTETDERTLLSCLVSNSLKHNPEDSGQIRVSCVEDETDCVISVSDTGPGIPECYAETIFQPLTTLKPRDDVEGSGMGLAIVRKIAQHYGGSAVLANAGDPTGACFEVRIRQDGTS